MMWCINSLNNLSLLGLPFWKLMQFIQFCGLSLLHLQLQIQISCNCLLINSYKSNYGSACSVGDSGKGVSLATSSSCFFLLGILCNNPYPTSHPRDPSPPHSWLGMMIHYTINIKTYKNMVVISPLCNYPILSYKGTILAAYRDILPQEHKNRLRFSVSNVDFQWYNQSEEWYLPFQQVN